MSAIQCTPSPSDVAPALCRGKTAVVIWLRSDLGLVGTAANASYNPLTQAGTKQIYLWRLVQWTAVTGLCNNLSPALLSAFTRGRSATSERAPFGTTTGTVPGECCYKLSSKISRLQSAQTSLFLLEKQLRHICGYMNTKRKATFRISNGKVWKYRFFICLLRLPVSPAPMW